MLTTIEKERERCRIKYRKNAESYRQHNKVYRQTEQGRLKHNAANRLYYQNNKDKVKARTLVNLALSKGEIQKGECSCSSFGWKCDGRIEAHHWDYNKPLDIVWFCSKHHELPDKVYTLLTK